MKKVLALTILLASLAAAACNGTTAPAPGPPVQGPFPLPRPDHVVIVMEENRGYDQIIGNQQAPYINQLARAGALMTDSHGVAHPSQPNYLAIFSGSTQGITNDSCPHSFDGPNLAQALVTKGLTFGGYSETMPSAGFTGCENGKYRRKHNPWVNFTNVDAAMNMPIGSLPADYSRLPTVSFIVPDLNNDMHDGTVAAADTWLQTRIDGYVQWAQSHNSLLIITYDEDDNTRSNRIPTIFIGPMVKPGSYSQWIDHYNVLRTVTEMYGLPALGESRSAEPVKEIWQP